MSDNLFTQPNNNIQVNFDSVFNDETKSTLAACSSVATGNIDIPGSVATIKRKAFYYCTDETSINIPNSVTSIEPYAFYNCSKLDSITIPDGVTIIDDYTFSQCYKLQNIT